MSILIFTTFASAQDENTDFREHLWLSFLTPPDSIRVGCYYYWVNEHVDPKGVVADPNGSKECWNPLHGIIINSEQASGVCWS